MNLLVYVDSNFFLSSFVIYKLLHRSLPCQKRRFVEVKIYLQHNSHIKQDRGTDSLSCKCVSYIMIVRNNHPVPAIGKPPFRCKVVPQAYNFRSDPNFSCSSTSSFPSRLIYTTIALTKIGLCIVCLV